jgi:hypothetical protein
VVLEAPRLEGQTALRSRAVRIPIARQTVTADATASSVSHFERHHHRIIYLRPGRLFI